MEKIKDIILEKYKIVYSCGCEHEIQVPKNRMHEPTGVEKKCAEHKEKSHE